MLLERKVALVTGGGRGMGAAIARVLAREGATSPSTTASAEKAEAVVAEIEEAGGTAQAFGADVRDARGGAEHDGKRRRSLRAPGRRRQQRHWREAERSSLSQRWRTIRPRSISAAGGRQHDQGGAPDHADAGRGAHRQHRDGVVEHGSRRTGRSIWRARARWSACRGRWLSSWGRRTSRSTWSRPAGWRMRRWTPTRRLAELRQNTAPAAAWQRGRDRQRLRVLPERSGRLRHRRLSAGDRRAHHAGRDVASANVVLH